MAVSHICGAQILVHDKAIMACQHTGWRQVCGAAHFARSAVARFGGVGCENPETIHDNTDELPVETEHFMSRVMKNVGIRTESKYHARILASWSTREMHCE